MEASMEAAPAEPGDVQQSDRSVEAATKTVTTGEQSPAGKATETDSSQLNVQTDLGSEAEPPINGLINGELREDGSDADSQKGAPLSPLGSSGSRKEPRAKMCMSPNKAAVAACAASTVTLKAHNARKSLTTGHALTSVTSEGNGKREKRLASIKDSGATNQNGHASDQDSKGKTESAEKADEPQYKDSAETDSSKPETRVNKNSVAKSVSRSPSQEKGAIDSAKASPMSLSSERATPERAGSVDRCSDKSLSPGKSGPKARKTVPKSASQPTTTPAATTSSTASTTPKTLSLSGSSLTNVTLRLNEIEKTLGIRSSTLATIDAKSLDKLILEKATQKAREKRDSKTPQQDAARLGGSLTERDPSPTEKLEDKPSKSQVKQDKDASISKESAFDKEESSVVKEEATTQEAIDNVVLAIRPKLLGKNSKKRKRRTGTYFLPGTKKKKVPTATLR